MKTFTKTDNETLDYTVDYSKVLESGETISTYVVTVPSGITKVSDDNDDSHVVVWLTAGTTGTSYEITVEVTTSASRVYERSFTVQVADNG